MSKKLGTEIKRRQDAPKVLQLTAGILVVRRKVLLENDTVYTDKVKPYVMPEEKSIMIDNELDFKMAELLLRERIVDIYWVKK